MAILGFDIGILINNIFRTIFYMLDIIIYKLMINIYNVFVMLCSGRLLNSDTIKQLSTRVGTILGVIMMFMVIFSFIQMLINPESISDKEKGIGNIAKKVIIVLVMLGTYTYIFNLLNNIQTALIQSNAIANLLVPSSVNTENFGGALSGSLFTAFYTSNFREDEFEHQCTTENFEETLKNEIAINQDFSSGYECLYETDDTLFGTTTYLRDFNWLLSFIVGVVVVYFIFYYCISVGMRIAQLAFLQIIAPMPIISYLTPKKDNMFNKWAKIYFTTYIDVFIRIAIINFVAYLIGVIMDNWNSGNGVFWQSLGIDATTEIGLKTIVGVIMIIALLLFAKKAPDLIKELFPTAPGSLGFGIKSPKALFKDVAESPITAPIGFLGKRALGGIDSVMNGQSFWRGVGMSFFGGDFLQKYMPMTAENRKHKQEGRREVTEIDNKWRGGIEIALNILDEAKRNNIPISDENGNIVFEWKKVFNGQKTNERYYRRIFKNEEFIQSKMAVDKNKKIEEQYKFIQNAITSSGGIENYLNATGATSIEINGNNYDASNMQKFQDDYQSASDTLASVKEVHESIRKQYHKEAKLEDQFKFIKNNDTNPANTNQKFNDEIKNKIKRN